MLDQLAFGILITWYYVYIPNTYLGAFCHVSAVLLPTDKSMVTKKVDGIKESSDSSAVIEDEDGQGNWLMLVRPSCVTWQ